MDNLGLPEQAGTLIGFQDGFYYAITNNGAGCMRFPTTWTPIDQSETYSISCDVFYSGDWSEMHIESDLITYDYAADRFFGETGSKLHNISTCIFCLQIT